MSGRTEGGDAGGDAGGRSPEQSTERPAELEVREVAQYRIEQVVARGGFGVVCRATDTTLDRTVALKLLDDGHRADGLIAEARNTSRIAHRGIAQVYQAGVDAKTGLPFIAFEWVEGPTLRAILRRGGLPLLQVLRIGQDVAAALSAAHEQDLVHGDLKADNIVITEGGRAKLLDFGLSVPDEVLGDGELWGTPAYMAPELFAGGKRTPESDLFALGVLLYELVTGTLPFGGEDGDEHKVRKRQEEPAPHPREERNDIPAEVADRVRSLVVRDPAERGPTALELERVLRHLRRAAERPPTRILPISVLLLVGLLGWFFRADLGFVSDPGTSDPGRRGTAVAPVVSVGVWTGPGGGESEESRRLRDLLALHLTGVDPGSAVITNAGAPAVSGTTERVSRIDGAEEWIARWDSPTGRGTREERAAGALELARRVAERVKADGTSNRTATTIDAPESALVAFCEAVRTTRDGDLAVARRRFAEARRTAGAFPEAAAWEAALWLVEDRPEEALSLLAPLRDVTTAPAAILRAALEIPIRDRSARWGTEHRLARLVDLALARRDPSVPDTELARRCEVMTGTGLLWLATTRVELELRAGDLGAATDALERARLLASAGPDAGLWRLEHAIALAGTDRAAAMDVFQDRLFEVPPGSTLDWLRMPFLLQKGRLGPAITAAERLDPSPESRRAVVLVLAIGGRFDEAISRVNAIEDPYDPSSPSRVRGAVEMLRGDAESAVRSLHEARQVDPGHPLTELLLAYVEAPAYRFPDPEVASGTEVARVSEPFVSIGRARTLRVDGDPAAGVDLLAPVRFVEDDLTLTLWPEVVYLAWLERIACLHAAGRTEDAQDEWTTFRKWWPEDRPEESRVTATAREVDAFLKSDEASGD